MTESEAAAYLGITDRTLYSIRKAGGILYRTIPTKARPRIDYDQADLDRLKAEREGRASARKEKVKTPRRDARQPTVTFGLPPKDYDELKDEAARYGLPVSVFARRLVRECLESNIRMQLEQQQQEIEKLGAGLRKQRKEFADGLEVILEFMGSFTGMTSEEARVWVDKNLR